MPVRENQPDLTPIPIDDGKVDPPLPIRERRDGEPAPRSSREAKPVDGLPANAAAGPVVPAVNVTPANGSVDAATGKGSRNRGPQMRKKYPFPS